MEKLCRKFAPKASPIPLINFAKYPKTAILHTRNYFGNTVFLKRIIKKPLTFFFLLNPVVFNGQSYQKQKRSGSSPQSLFRPQKNSSTKIQNYKFRKIPLFIIYYLTKFHDVM